MSMLLNFVKSFVREEEGQDLLEYALLVALIALIAIGAVGAAGGKRVHHLHEHRGPARRRGVIRRVRHGGRRVAPVLCLPINIVGSEWFVRGAQPMPSIAIATLKRMLNARLRRADEGQDLLEYGLLMALIAIFAIGAVSTVGNTINTVFWQSIANNF